MATAATSKAMPEPRNGIDTPKLLTNAVGARPELAKSQFRAENRWQTERVKVLRHRVSQLTGREERLVQSLDGARPAAAEALA
jgi:hypothetical protein